MTSANRIDAFAALSSVDELRELLVGIPGTAKFSIDALPEGALFDTLALLTALDDGELCTQSFTVSPASAFAKQVA